MIVTDTGAGYEPVPAGVQRAVCVNVIDIGYQLGLDGSPVHQCVILWELDAVKQDGTPFLVSRRYTASINEKAHLRAHLQSWRAREFSAEELEGFDLNRIIGANCRLNLVEKTKNNKRVVEVDSVLSPEKGQSVKGITPREFIPGWVAKCIRDQLPPPPKNPKPPSKATVAEPVAPTF